MLQRLNNYMRYNRIQKYIQINSFLRYHWHRFDEHNLEKTLKFLLLIQT